MDEFEQRSREIARAILERHGWKRPMTAEVKEMREIADEPLMECKRYLLEEWQNKRIPLLEKENEQLRRERDFFFQQVTENGERAHGAIDVLNAENEKLRELVRDMWDWLAPTAVGGGAPLRGLHNRMRELGVDFDG